jgi:hypothetical protein
MRKLKYFGVLCALLLLALLLGAYLCLRGSLPQLDGQLRQAELAAPVRITRDARGVPTIEAAIVAKRGSSIKAARPIASNSRPQCASLTAITEM